MPMCIQKKQKGKSDSLTVVNGSISSAILVKRSVKKKYPTIEKARSIIAQKSVRELPIQNYHFGNTVLTEELDKSEKISGFTMSDTENHTPNEYPISRPEDTQESETPKVRIPWKNGWLSKRDLLIGVLPAEREKSLRKTISSLYPSVEQTT